MGFFSRNKGKPPREPFAGGPCDEVYPELSQAQGSTYRKIWAEELQKRGLPPQSDETQYLFPSGMVLDLVAMAGGCARRPVTAWSELLNANLDACLEPSDDEAEMRNAPRENIFVYVCTPADISDMNYTPREPLPGLIAPLAVAVSDGILVSPNAPEELGLSVDDAYEVALENLGRRPLQTHDICVSPDGEPYTTIRLCAFSGYAPSHVMRLREVLTQLGEPFPEYGVLIAVPNPVVMAVHVPRDVGVLGAVSTLGDFAQGECDLDGDGVSPHVFVVRPDGATARVTHMKDDGTMAFDGASGPFHQMLLALGVINN